MGRLANSTVYLCGSIDKSPDCGIGWRDDITKWLESLNVKVINPCNKWFLKERYTEGKSFLEFRKQLKQEGRYDELSRIVKDIRHLDLRLVDYCTWLILYVDMSVPLFGSIEELSWAVRCKKPTLVVCKQGKNELSDWCFGMVPHQMIFDNFEDMKKYVEYVDVGENVDDLGRWVFWDFKLM